MFKSGGVKARATLILLFMALLTGASLLVGVLAFRSIQSHFATISAERVPELESTTHLITATGGLTERLLRLGNASSVEGVDLAQIDVNAQLIDIRQQIDAMWPEARDQFEGQLAAVALNIEALTVARNLEFLAAEEIDTQLQALVMLSNEATLLTSPMVDEAYFNLVLGGKKTIGAVSETLSSIVEKDFLHVSEVLEIRAQINLLSGLAMTISLSEDPALISILKDLSEASLAHLKKVVPNLRMRDLDPSYVENIEASVAFYQTMLPERGPVNALPRNKVLQMRRQADVALSSILDDMIFFLTIVSAEASESNKKSIQSLLDVQVGNIRELASLDSALQRFVATAFTVAVATNETALGIAKDHLNIAAGSLETLADSAPEGLTGIVTRLLEVTNSETGVAANRSQVLNARTSATSIAGKAAFSVEDIASRAGQLAILTLQRITASGSILDDEINKSSKAMYLIAGVSIIVFILALIITQKSLVHPLEALANTTERLANGDMAPIKGFKNRNDEIGRLGAALAVFRENSLKVEELRKSNEERDKTASENRHAMFRLLSDEIGTVVSAACAGDFSLRVDKSFEDPEVAKLGHDVNQLMETTEHGLAETRQALAAMAAADLSHRMPSGFSGIFETLSNDVNATFVTLSDLIGGIRDSAAASADQARQITEGAQQLAQRAESQAHALEETSSSLEEMSTSVTANAQSLTEAENLSKQVAEKTASGSEAAISAVNNVERIQESSEKINDIISVIETISFQTNLLALNAAVEAARAGDAGKGFAVVASEVRALAQRSADAAQEITNLIRESREKVSRGVESVEAARTSFADIEQSVRPVITLLSQVAQSGREQALGIEEVSASATRMDSMTQENARMADNSTSLAGELSARIQSLQTMVSSFKISAPKGQMRVLENPSKSQAPSMGRDKFADKPPFEAEG